MSTPTLFIASGHGGTDPGNTTTGRIERDEVISFVDGMREYAALAAIPHGLGGVVFVPHRFALGEQLTYLLRTWKATNADLAIDIHLDYHKGASGGLCIADRTETALPAAQRIMAAWSMQTGIRNRGVFDSIRAAQEWRGWPDYGWTAAAFAGIIFELGCINSLYDVTRIRDVNNQHTAMRIIWEAWKALA